MTKAKPLHVVGQRADGNYEIFTLPLVPDGDGIDTAEASCTERGLRYIHCARPKVRGMKAG